MSKPLETAIVKTPYTKMSVTEAQILEFAKCADPVTGPKHFMDNYFFIQHPTKGAIQYHPFEYQERLIDTYHNYRFSISLMPRQTGKSTSAAGYLLWYAMFVPDSTILVAAHKYLGAQEIMQRVRYAYENCPDFIRAGVTSYNKGSLDFENGSRIVSQTTTENTGRGMSISLLYCDEFAFVRPTIASEFWTSITPTLATGGKCIITSTPNSDEDQFAQIWRGANKCFDEFGNETLLGVNGFKAFRSAWQEHPDRDDKWADQMRAQLGEERFRREMECEFIIFDETLINPLHLAAMAGIDPMEKQGQIRWYKRPEKDKTYVVALDPSLGTGGDPAAIQVLELPGLKQVAEWSHNKTIVQRQVVIMKEICQYLTETAGVNNVYYSVENNTLGEAALVAINEVGEENIPGIFLSEPKKLSGGRYRKGFTTSNKSKLSACSKFKSLVETKRLVIASKALISEMKVFVASGGSYAAKLGDHDDLVMSMLLAIRMVMMLQQYDAAMDAELRDTADTFVEPLPFVMI
ncbi:MAG TPA: terminase family protein [Methanosarcina sp.]|nr:terminase family protein [Methanosarcina sp.]